MKYLLDTCVISELIQKAPSPSVLTWINSQTEEHLFLSVITMGELRKGINLLFAGKKRRALEAWLENDLEKRFLERWLPVTLEISEYWGAMSAHAQLAGNPLPVLDSLIAATAITQGCTLVTRNTRDMLATGAVLLNPWDG